jgi:hypothetical protein
MSNRSSHALVIAALTYAAAGLLRPAKSARGQNNAAPGAVTERQRCWRS